MTESMNTEMKSSRMPCHIRQWCKYQDIILFYTILFSLPMLFNLL